MDVEAEPDNVLVARLAIGYLRVEVDVGIDLETLEGLAVADGIFPPTLLLLLPIMQRQRGLREIDVGVIRASVDARIPRRRGVCVVHNGPPNLLLIYQRRPDVRSVWMDSQSFGAS